MHNIKTNFYKILNAVTEVLQGQTDYLGNFPRRGSKPKFSDMEVIALSLTAECLSIDSENLLFSKIKAEHLADFPNLISRRQYNDRRKALFYYQEQVRKSLAKTIHPQPSVCSVDSMPVEVCRISRMQRCKMGKENFETAPDKGYCAAQKKWFYGYKLHGVCDHTGVIHTVDLTKASIHDIHYLQDVKDEIHHCILTGDKGYISKTIATDLFHQASITLEVPGRTNQKDQKKLMKPLSRYRKRIETVFAQLCDQFMIQRNYAKSFMGFKTRIIAKIAGLTVLQFLNKFVNNLPVGRVKHALA